MKSKMRALFVATSLFLAALWPAAPVMGARPRRAPQPPPPPPPAQQPQAEAPPPPPPKHPVAQCLQDKTNELRAGNGLPQLLEIPSLLDVAQKHSDVMASSQYLHHSTETVFGLLPAGWLAYGENVVSGTSCEQMFEAFVGSDPHREAMLRPDFNVGGTAISVSSEGAFYATLVFLNLPNPHSHLGPPGPAVVPGPSVPAAAPATPPAQIGPPSVSVPPPPVAVSVEVGPPTISLGSAPGSAPAVSDRQQLSSGSNGAKQSPVSRRGSGKDEGRVELVPGDASPFFEFLEEDEVSAWTGPDNPLEIAFDIDSTGKPGPRPSSMS